MKDKQGIIRGKCTSPGCECTEYLMPQDPTTARCDYCDHVPVKHLKMIKLGACTRCSECASYESEQSGSYSDCGYCECPAQAHKGAEQLFKPPAPTPMQVPVSRPPGAPTSMVPVSGPPGASLSMVPGTGPPSMQPKAPGQCKLPGCYKPCFVENGKVHDFCGKGHAKTYNQQPMMQQVPQPTASVTSRSVPLGPGSMQMPSTKVCDKCGQRPPNPGKGWCQACYTKSKAT